MRGPESVSNSSAVWQVAEVGTEGAEDQNGESRGQIVQGCEMEPNVPQMGQDGSNCMYAEVGMPTWTCDSHRVPANERNGHPL